MINKILVKEGDLAYTVAAGGGLAHPSVMACSWYMKLCKRVLFGWRPAAVASAAPPSPPNAPNPARLPPPPSESWNVAYGEMSSAVSVTHQRHCLPFKSRRANCLSRPSVAISYSFARRCAKLNLLELSIWQLFLTHELATIFFILTPIEEY